MGNSKLLHLAKAVYQGIVIRLREDAFEMGDLPCNLIQTRMLLLDWRLFVDGLICVGWKVLVAICAIAIWTVGALVTGDLVDKLFSGRGLANELQKG